jgi:AraC-like DNA-binding protein
MLRGGTAPSWSALAQGCGYYDQSHMIRDFHAFSGMTPVEFARRLLPEDAGIADA